MIKSIDEDLKRWGDWRRKPEGSSPPHPLAVLIANRGEIIRGSARGTSCPLDNLADIDLLYSKYLRKDMRKLMRLYYIEAQELSLQQQAEAIGISVRTFYRRLDLLHAVIAEHIYKRRAA